MKLLFCVNAGAGPRRSIDWTESIGTYFEGGPHAATVLMLGEDRRKAVEEMIAKLDPDRVVAVGGDGTVNLLATIVGGTGRPLGIIPAGSANGLATELGLPSDPEAAFQLMTEGEPKPLDAILINEKDLCLHLADLGMNARMIKYFDNTEGRGMLVYARLSMKVIFNSDRFKVQVKSDTGNVERWAFMVVLANARKYGTGATINKGGDLSDGFFEVVLVRRYGLKELWASLSERRRFDPRRIEVIRACEVVIRTRNKAHFQIDGDHKGKVNEVRARILKDHVRIIVP